MNLWSLPLIAGLSLALPLVPTSAEAPGQVSSSAANAFSGVGESGFSYRWLSDEDIEAEHLECNSYLLCSFADIAGPSCPHEVFVALDYFDLNGALITSGGDVLPSGGRQRHIQVELGTNWVETFDTFEVTDIGCYLGLPTGKPDL
jgi:hypothetical protein